MQKLIEKKSYLHVQKLLSWHWRKSYNLSYKTLIYCKVSKYNSVIYYLSYVFHAYENKIRTVLTGFHSFLNPIYKCIHSGVVAVLVRLGTSISPADDTNSDPLRITPSPYLANKGPATVSFTWVAFSSPVPSTKCHGWVVWENWFVWTKKLWKHHNEELWKCHYGELILQVVRLVLFPTLSLHR